MKTLMLGCLPLVWYIYYCPVPLLIKIELPSCPLRSKMSLSEITIDPGPWIHDIAGSVDSRKSQGVHQLIIHSLQRHQCPSAQTSVPWEFLSLQCPKWPSCVSFSQQLHDDSSSAYRRRPRRPHFLRVQSVGIGVTSCRSSEEGKRQKKARKAGFQKQFTMTAMKSIVVYWWVNMHVFREGIQYNHGDKPNGGFMAVPFCLTCCGLQIFSIRVSISILLRTRPVS